MVKSTGRFWKVGTSGTDFITGGDGRDRIFGGGGDDVISTDGGKDFVHGGSGDDLIHGGADNDFLFGGANNDAIFGDGGRDRIFGGSGNDTINAGSGSDHVYGGSDDDVIDGGAGNDHIRAGSGDDVILGSAGRDRIWGGSGSDTYVYTSPDQAGDTIRDFDPKSDTLDLSGLMDEVDSIQFVQQGRHVQVMIVQDGVATPFLTLKHVSLDDLTTENLLMSAPAPEGQVILATGDNEFIQLGPQFGPADNVSEVSADGHTMVAIVGTSGNDYLDFSATTLTGINSIDGLEGNDVIIGSAGDDVILGGAGDDLMDGGGGVNTLDGGTGNDTYLVGHASGVNAYNDSGGDANDRVIADTDGVAIQMNFFHSSFGIEEISADGHTGVTISGTEDGDLLIFSAASSGGPLPSTTLTGIESINGLGGDDTIWGSEGADVIDGGVGADTIDGGIGADTIIGGEGADTLTGGTGADTFVYGGYANGEGGDTIVDFDAAEGDTLDLSALLASPEVDSYTLEQIDGDTHVVLNLAAGGTEDYITLTGTTATDVMVV